MPRLWLPSQLKNITMYSILLLLGHRVWWTCLGRNRTLDLIASETSSRASAGCNQNNQT